MNLTNVVKQSSRFDLFDFSSGQAQFDGNGPGKFTDANGVTRCVWISGFNSFDHQLKEFLTAILKLMIQSVHVPNSNHWQNYADETNRAKTEPTLDGRVKIGDKKRRYARPQIVSKYATCVQAPNLSEGSFRANRDNSAYKRGIDQEIQCGKGKEEAEVAL